LEWWIFLGGGLVGVLLTFVAQGIMQRQKLRAELTVTLVAWLDETRRMLVALGGQKMLRDQQTGEIVPDTEWKSYQAQVAHRIVQSEMPVRIALIYGMGAELTLFNKLRDEMNKAYQNVIKIQRVGRQEYISRTLDEAFMHRFDSLSQELQRLLLFKVSPVWRFLYDRPIGGKIM
jgi:hypothetical protein